MRSLPLSLAACALSLGLLTSSGVAAAGAPASAEGAYDTPADLGFHDVRADGSARPLRDDLDGPLAAQVELAQSHTVNPTGNAALELPTVVARRAALLLVSPHGDPGSLRVTASLGGRLLGDLPLAHPHALPASDQEAPAGRQSVMYSRRAWSAELPWHWVVPGLRLTLTDASGTTGALSSIDVAAPTELVLNNIELGMLTDPPASAGHRLLNQPAVGGTDYFQTVPVSRLVVAKYDGVRLDKVIVASGAIYQAPGTSSGEGGVYSGDMRENVAKAQVATGINLAGFGITSAPMTQSQPGTFNQRIIHHAAGAYTNGRQVHGLSGGNGMATLYDSVGNELSHELGHSYGLGHYPGTDPAAEGDAKIINATHHADSGWGWMAHRDRMRSNLSLGAYQPEGRSINGYHFSQTFAGQYNFNTDAMAGGWDASPLSDYTHHTGYSAKRVQANLRTVVPDTAYPSGYRAWDRTTGEYVDAKTLDPAFGARAPEQVGVPVLTLLGGYNPAVPAQTVLYPAFRSNYGNTFDLPAPDLSGATTARQCWVEVTHLGGRVERITLSAADGVKQLNVNLAQSDRPQGARVLCRTDQTTTQLGDPITIPTDLAPMEPAVVIGQEAGHEALRAVELDRLEPVLVSVTDARTPVLGAADALVLHSWRDDLSRLGPVAREVARRILDQHAKVTRVERFLNRYATELAAGDRARKVELRRLLETEGLVEDSGAVLPAGARVVVDGGKCLRLDTSGSTPEAWVSEAAGCGDGPAFRWFADARGALHSRLRPDLCVSAGSPVSMTRCTASDSGQEWLLQADGHVVRRSAPGNALDLNRATRRPGVYGRTDGGNQLWRTFPVSTNPLLVGLGHRSLGVLFGLGLDDLVDTDPPVVTLTTTPSGAADGSWTSGPLVVAATATDDFGLPTDLEVSVGDGAWTSYSGGLAVGEGETVVRVRGTDRVGNVSAPTSLTLRRDSTAPTSTSTYDPATRQVGLVARDALSGVARLEYRAGQAGAWLTYGGPVRVDGSTGTLQHRAVDGAGNVESAHTLATPVDRTAVDQPSGQRATSRTTAKARKEVRSGQLFKVRITVRAAGRVSGKVLVNVKRKGSRKPTHKVVVTLSTGRTAGIAKATVTVPGKRLVPGRYRVKATYLGTPQTFGSRGITLTRFSR